MNSRWVCLWFGPGNLFFQAKDFFSVGRQFCWRSWGERFWKNLPCHSWLQQRSCGGLRVWGACPAVSKSLSKWEDHSGEAPCTQVGWQLPPGQQVGSAPKTLRHLSSGPALALAPVGTAQGGVGARKLGDRARGI